MIVSTIWEQVKCYAHMGVGAAVASGAASLELYEGDQHCVRDNARVKDHLQGCYKGKWNENKKAMYGSEGTLQRVFNRNVA